MPSRRTAQQREALRTMVRDAIETSLHDTDQHFSPRARRRYCIAVISISSALTLVAAALLATAISLYTLAADGTGPVRIVGGPECSAPASPGPM